MQITSARLDKVESTLSQPRGHVVVSTNKQSATGLMGPPASTLITDHINVSVILVEIDNHRLINNSVGKTTD